MISSLKRQMSIAENERAAKESLATELQIGHEIQISILPQSMPTLLGLDIGARYLSAKEVGGDFYDLFVRQDPKTHRDNLVITVADASGKGISACLYSFCLRSMLRSFYLDCEDVGNIATQANNLFCLDTGETGMFVTAFIALYDPQLRKLSYTCSGHNPAFLFRKNGQVEKLTTHGVAMGVIEQKERAATGTVQLEQGDLVCFYTDGITEAHNESNELFGEQRLIASIQKNLHLPSQEIADKVVADLTHYSGSAGQHDDITIVVITASGESSSSTDWTS
jgi:sigma-B regulation protein RsbU (phosphoserine phosphatase)